MSNNSIADPLAPPEAPTDRDEYFWNILVSTDMPLPNEKNSIVGNSEDRPSEPDQGNDVPPKISQMQKSRLGQ
jgi:hypothetical protein